MLVFRLAVTLPEPAVKIPTVNQQKFLASVIPAPSLFANQNAILSVVTWTVSLALSRMRKDVKSVNAWKSAQWVHCGTDRVRSAAPHFFARCVSQATKPTRMAVKRVSVAIPKNKFINR